ncbi:MAG: hypothetical protein C5B47_01510 [Verrucomicrobia bacterium]|nr:MAG: hypothetical protein C5B47_01510 [Verrucomicrobiota bacterium]
MSNINNITAVTLPLDYTLYGADQKNKDVPPQNTPQPQGGTDKSSKLAHKAHVHMPGKTINLKGTDNDPAPTWDPVKWAPLTEDEFNAIKNHSDSNYNPKFSQLTKNQQETLVLDEARAVKQAIQDKGGNIDFTAKDGLEPFYNEIFEKLPSPGSGPDASETQIFDWLKNNFIADYLQAHPPAQ